MRRLQVTSYRPQATGHKPQATIRDVRPAAILVPLGAALASAGIVLYYGSRQPSAIVSDRTTPGEKIVSINNEPRHPVSPLMVREAALIARKTAPFFKLKDAHGIDIQIGGTGSKPQFIYFILEGCPCSLDAQPLFNRMYQRYKDRVDFIGVINAGKAKALDFAGETTTLHPIVCDEHLTVIKAYGAKQSTYNAVVRPDGTVERMWPGYSQSYLHELNSVLARLTGTKEEPFDAAYAPVKPASGCVF